ncbi:MAG: adenosylcobinamide amidohydrolase, partial [Myxococcota bacterium]
TGTGTDCIVLAAPPGHAVYAGLHTAVGEAVGRAVYDAVAAGVRGWMAEP